MKRRTKKKRDKQLLGELWQHQNEPMVKHWSVACKHSMKHYEQELRNFFGCRNTLEARLAVAINPMVQGILVTPGGAVVIRKKDIINTSTLDLLKKKVQQLQHDYIEQVKRDAEMTFTIKDVTEGDYEEILRQLMQGT